MILPRHFLLYDLPINVVTEASWTVLFNNNAFSSVCLPFINHLVLRVLFKCTHLNVVNSSRIVISTRWCSREAIFRYDYFWIIVVIGYPV